MECVVAICPSSFVERRCKCLAGRPARATKTLRGTETSRMFAESIAAAASFDSNQLYIFVFQKLVEEADGVRAAAYASEKMRG